MLRNTVFMNKLSMHINCKTTNRIWFNITNVIFGKIPLNEGNKVDDFIFLYTKQYIFNRLKKKKIPYLLEGAITTHLFQIYMYEDTFKDMCMSNKSCENWKFDNDWSKWKNIFEPYFFGKHRNVFLIIYKLQA